MVAGIGLYAYMAAWGQTRSDGAGRKLVTIIALISSAGGTRDFGWILPTDPAHKGATECASGYAWQKAPPWWRHSARRRMTAKPVLFLIG